MAAAANLLLLLLGIAILYWGSAWLIRGSARIARALGVKPLVVGLIVAAYSMSAPELAVSTKTALTHHTPIALGVVIGSCVANISLILGLSALIKPPTIDSRIIRRELPVLIGSAVVVPVFLRNKILSEAEGLALIGCAILFTIVTLTVSARFDPDDAYEAEARRAEDAARTLGRSGSSSLVAIGMTLLGIGLLVIGSKLLVSGGRGIGTQLGMSERMLGLTFISLGTALPELIGSVVASVRGRSAVAIGSVIGSNLLNVFLVLGVTATLRPIRLGERMHLVDLIGLVAITLLGALVLRGSRKISRIEGAILVCAYIAFLVCAAIF
ncbi:MAG TPA: calcium/sodium antiporter [Kofleriaceae bacterium]